MFGKVSCIRREMSGYFLDYRERIDGDRWDFRIHSNSGEWSGNIYDFVSEVMPRLSLKIGSSFELEGFVNVGGSRTLASVREAVLNGVIHADYNLSTGVEVQWTPRMLKVTNPGTMRVPVREAKKGGRSDPRNGTLVALAMAAGWVERIGSGLFAIDRSVSDGYLESFDIIENTDPSTVTAILEFPLLGARASGNASAAMRIIAARPDITRAELAQEMGVSLSTVANTLSELKISRRIERIGGNRKGYWRIIERSPSLSHRPPGNESPEYRSKVKQSKQAVLHIPRRGYGMRRRKRYDNA